MYSVRADNFQRTGRNNYKGWRVFIYRAVPDNRKQNQTTIRNLVFETAKDSDFKIPEICTPVFLQRSEKANDYDTKGYATWLLRSGMQDGDDTLSKVTSIIPGKDNTVIVSWSDMGHKGFTTFTMIESDGTWKINDATVPDGYNPL